MKISIGQITTLTKDMQTDAETFPLAGFKNVELAFPKVYKYLETHTISELRKLFDDSGLQAVSAIGMAPTNAGVLYAKGKEIDIYFKSLAAQVELCHSMGCTLINLGSDPDELQYPNWEEQAVNNLQTAGEIVAKYGMQVALEDGNLSRSISLINKANMKNVGYCIDFFWYFKHNQTVEQFETFDFSKLFNIHFCDLPTNFCPQTMDDGIRVLPGDGVLPLSQWAKMLVSQGFNGYLTLELLNKEIWNMQAPKACAVAMGAMRPYISI